jgi:gluconate 2-dehydrogenase gamma chain
MANQSPDRRRVLELLAKAAIASQFPGFSRWTFAAAPDQPKTSTYQLQYFTPAEFRTIEMLAGLIIPTDETPGAKEAGVSEFIDFMAAHGDRGLIPMRAGLQWIDSRSHGSFANLPGAQQEELLKSMAYRQGDPQGQAFFKLIRDYTVMGYYTSRVGLEELDYPGLEFYTRSPECPHKDDPEHRHLPPPKVK